MPDTPYIWAAVLICTAITWALRALPFAALAPLRSSDTVHHLGDHMPVGSMVILTVYTLRDLPLATAPYGLPAIAALTATAALHLWQRKAVLSILGGTAVHVALASTVFAH
ncbi:branched-chain amino acid transporter permease [Streptomyces sp. FIT100]|uniref:branched-chain amino acid transporter permease n=1 Tax=Streptomyces sp. FIT100 TaxID=2837956 RepID=UPI0021C778F2|nr:AzlD domain-containing protein [Streptomyces sp. FIT100]UUN27926.1 AzlD domain-containing protein [Streptomyces sp. FIT100]